MSDPWNDPRSEDDLTSVVYERRDRPWGIGLASERPAANLVPRNSFWYSTDTGVPSFSNATTWADIGGGAVATSIAALADSPVGGAQATLRLGSSPYSFVPLTYDSTYAKWVSPSFGVHGAADQVAFSTTITSAIDVDTIPRVPLFFYKAHYDAGLRLYARALAFMSNNTGGQSTRVYIRTDDFDDGDTTGAGLVVVQMLTITSVTNTYKVADWTHVSTVAPTQTHGIAKMQMDVSGGTGTIQVFQLSYRWEAAAA